ncbi:TIGR03749 family integrating conjugative element protein [Salmonella enterica subsp. enterica serovar London]|uniref:TIGR03749 family integrating conjugative element protein n=5 Tax=Salmonella enterica subsp. salamae TaxID=59202 RepID=A0A6C7D2P6_SALER|nr:TIGR03749 family integrating conjugative element protein [Salmonella enterica]EAB9860151.1 TIGR03749 family integrating conjugative element protein [Salmonella enterica subsp. salamae]EBI0478691.1 TIGR03749 family integrating conjugative element protein [Salmonella enterica subsp. enterica serovar Braenderup]EIR0424117.1 TIGR03749 family integrating conjugative element protein [Salmonella enterica subsp. enterica serovar London]HAC6504074.1 TIGR03749 family integrating conjugative element pr
MNAHPLLILLVALPLHAVELVKWERIPLPVALNIGQERIVFVDRNVRVGYPAALEGKLRIQSSNGTLYLLASQPFAATRLQLQDTENGELMLLDVSASKGEHIREPMRIVREEKKTTDAKPDAVPEPLPSTPLPVALTRYAAQMLYAPLRTVEPLPGVQPEGVRLAKTITTLLPALPVSTIPIGGWRLDPYHLAAIRLQNKSATRLELDPRQLQGRFYAASFQHRWLGPSGSAEDTTVLYLITRNQRLEQAILPEPAPEKKK